MEITRLLFVESIKSHSDPTTFERNSLTPQMFISARRKKKKKKGRNSIRKRLFPVKIIPETGQGRRLRDAGPRKPGWKLVSKLNGVSRLRRRRRGESRRPTCRCNFTNFSH